MSDDRSALRKMSASRRRFLQGLAGVSFGATSLGALAACKTRTSRSPSSRLPLIGYIGVSTGPSGQANTKAVREGLEALDYRDGRTIRIEWRLEESDPGGWPATARELIDLQPKLIVVEGKPLVPLMLELTQSIPIVVVLQLVGAEQLTEAGWIKSQARPGGNVTGLVGTAATLPGKRLDLLHETVPDATRLAILRSSNLEDPYPSLPAWTRQATSIAISQPEDLDEAFARFEQAHAELLVLSTAGGLSRLLAILEQAAGLARRQRLPAICDFDAFARSGGLMTYSADRTALFRGVGRFVDKIVRGASPADLPVELPTTFGFAINKRTAGAIGLTIPPAVLAQATEVLE